MLDRGLGDDADGVKVTRSGRAPGPRSRITFPVPWLALTLALSVFLVGAGIWLVGYTETTVRGGMERQVRLERIRADIQHLDEVLTMSALMAATSGDPQWEARYRVYEPLLAAKIEAAFALLPEDDGLGVDATHTANAALVSMEREAFALVRSGREREALARLASPAYGAHKSRYAKGLDQLLERLDGLHADVIAAQRDRVRVSQGVGGLAWVLLLGAWLAVLRGIRRWRRSVLAARRKLARDQQRLAGRVRSMARDLTRVEQRERRRVAGLLHDDLQQILVAARLQLGVLPDTAQRARTDDLIEEAIQSARTLTVRLNPPGLMTGHLGDAVRWLGDWMDRNYALEVEVVETGTLPPLDDEVIVVGFNGVRELLFNVVKHAHIDRATVMVEPTAEAGVRVSVQDEGVGFAPSAHGAVEHSGLLNLSRRLKLMGGGVKLESRPTKGCRATLVLPPREGAVGGGEPGVTRPIVSDAGERDTQKMWSMPVEDLALLEVGRPLGSPRRLSS